MAKYKANVGSELLPGLSNLNGQDGLAKLVEMVLNQVPDKCAVQRIHFGQQADVFRRMAPYKRHSRRTAPCP